MEGSVVDRQIKLPVLEGQTLELGLHRCVLARVMAIGAQAVQVVGEQIDGGNCVASLRKTVGQPTVSGAEIEGEQRAGHPLLQRLEQPSLKGRVAARADLPVAAKAPGLVFKGQGAVVCRILASPPFAATHRLVLTGEAFEGCCALREQETPNAGLTAVERALVRAEQLVGGKRRKRRVAARAGEAWRGCAHCGS